MADNITLNAGTGGDTLAADDISGVKVQRVKLQHGGDGVAYDASKTYPVPVIQLPGNQNSGVSGFLKAGAVSNLIADYSGGGLAIASFGPSGSDVYRITKIIVSIVDGTGFSTALYGAGPALTNGIEIATTGDGGTITNLTGGVPVKTNAGWTRFGRATLLSMVGQVLTVEIDLSTLGMGLRLNAANNDKVQVLLNDNLSALDGHYFYVVGYDEGRLSPGY